MSNFTSWKSNRSWSRFCWIKMHASIYQIERIEKRRRFDHVFRMKSEKSSRPSLWFQLYITAIVWYCYGYITALNMARSIGVFTASYESQPRITGDVRSHRNQTKNHFYSFFSYLDVLAAEIWRSNSKPKTRRWRSAFPTSVYPITFIIVNRNRLQRAGIFSFFSYSRKKLILK